MITRTFGKLIGGAALLLMLLALAACGSDDRTAQVAAQTTTQAATEQATEAATEQATEAKTEQPTEAASGSDLVIPIAGITENAGFYPVDVDGTEMEVIAVMAPDGTIRTAFNTCQICYGSGRGYYVQEGDQLVCQNCGNRFDMSQVEMVSGGCNPWPILDEDKTTDETNITISYSFLKKSVTLFENWKSVQY